MKIIGIERIVYGVTEIQECIRYLVDWGFVHADARGPETVRFETAEKTGVELRRHDDPALPPLRHASPFFSGSCAREVIWGVDNAATLDAIGAELRKDRSVMVGGDASLHTSDDGGNAIGFCVTRRVPLALAPQPVNVPGAPLRINRQAEGAVKNMVARPLRINHVVYLAPEPAAARTCAAFYRDRLGFRVSENIGDKGFFMRAGGSGDHHNLLLECFGEGHRGLQHAAYEFRDIDHIMHRGRYLEEHGWQSHTGPGRHTLGSNLTWYFWSPLGGMMELISDMDQVTDEWQTRFIDPKTAGPPFAWMARPNPPEFKFGVPRQPRT